jgi:hypothetical protein
MASKPRIALGGTYLDNNGRTSVSVGAKNLQPGEDRIIADRLFEVLSQRHEKLNEEMDAPLVNIAGRWDVDIEYYCGKDRHSFYIEQDGNFVTGFHKGEFTTRPMYGLVENNSIKLFSTDRPSYMPETISGNRLPYFVNFTFHGTATNEKMEGGIYMGEYLRSTFTATRNKQTPQVNRRIVIPQGQPLSS